MDLRAKVAVVTGGASGIGLATCKLFAAKEAKVVVSDVNQAGVGAAVDEIRGAGGEAIGVVADVRDEASVEALMKETVSRLGGLDVVVANAGILRDGLLVRVDKETRAVKGKMSLRDFTEVIDVNLTGVFLTVREAVVQMVTLGKGGVIIPMSSVARHGNMGQTNYSAAKAGVAAMAVLWGAELARHRIRVAAIAPGFIETPMVMKDMKPEALEMWAKKIPVGRLGRPEEIASAASFIVENDLIDGVVIDVSGGIKI